MKHHAQRHGPSCVLVAVTGMSPAILTETAWALAQEKPRMLPAKVIAFATTRSREQIRREILGSGVWQRLRETLGAGPDELVFGDTGDHIRVFSRRGCELDDLRKPEENAAAADFILEHLRQFTENPEIRVVASIAGGRKSMGALLYAAMTLIGRESDRITHVLIDESLERRDPKFYLPSNAREGRGIALADVPFVPLRNGFTDLGRLPAGFSALVRRYTQGLGRAPETARIGVTERGVLVNGCKIPLARNETNALKFLLLLNTPRPELRGFQDVQQEFREFMKKGECDSKEELRKWVSSLRNHLRRAGSSWYPENRPHPLRLPPFSRAD